MRIGIVTPAPPRTQYGNRITALRWARQLRALGHRVDVTLEYAGQPWDLLLALHARRGHGAIIQFRTEHPDRPIVLALTGTDLYQDLAVSPEAHESLDLSDAYIVLQPEAVDELPEPHRPKAHVVYQSVRLPSRAAEAAEDAHRFEPRRTFDVMVIGHLREVKDPMRTAEAARLLPPESRIRVLHCGAAMDAEHEALARHELEINPRYRWLGEVPRWRVLRMLAGSPLFVHTSKLEGGANALGEALACGTPVLASDIPGNTGLLGPDYPGLFPVGDTAALASLLIRAECDPAFLQTLRARALVQRPLFTPAHERDSLATVLASAQ